MRRTKQSYLTQINAGLRTCELWVQEVDRAAARNDCPGKVDVLTHAKYAAGQVREAILRVEKQRGADAAVTVAQKRLAALNDQIDKAVQDAAPCFGHKRAEGAT